MKTAIFLSLLLLSCLAFSRPRSGEGVTSEEFWMEKDHFRVVIVKDQEGTVSASSVNGSCYSLYMVYEEDFNGFLTSYSEYGLRKNNILSRDCTETYGKCSAVFKTIGQDEESYKYLILLNKNLFAGGLYKIEHNFVNSTISQIGKYNINVFVMNSLKIVLFAAMFFSSCWILFSILPCS